MSQVNLPLIIENIATGSTTRHQHNNTDRLVSNLTRSTRHLDLVSYYKASVRSTLRSQNMLRYCAQVAQEQMLNARNIKLEQLTRGNSLVSQLNYAMAYLKHPIEFINNMALEYGLRPSKPIDPKKP